MVYDFDKVTDRRNTHALKWTVGENELPMWVADMDLETAPAVQEAILKRASHGIFGYDRYVLIDIDNGDVQIMPQNAVKDVVPFEA